MHSPAICRGKELEKREKKGKSEEDKKWIKEGRKKRNNLHVGLVEPHLAHRALTNAAGQ